MFLCFHRTMYSFLLWHLSHENISFFMSLSLIMNNKVLKMKDQYLFNSITLPYQWAQDMVDIH